MLKGSGPLKLAPIFEVVGCLYNKCTQSGIWKKWFGFNQGVAGT